MNPNFVASPDGMNDTFFQAYWNIINKDLLIVVQFIFSGHPAQFLFAHLVGFTPKSRPS